MSAAPGRRRIVFMATVKVCDIMAVARETGGTFRIDGKRHGGIAYLEYSDTTAQDPKSLLPLEPPL
ncbi:MAG TPA: hypothetical protein VIY90_12165 [Steroidobacteraceae bacterium]